MKRWICLDEMYDWLPHPTAPDPMVVQAHPSHYAQVDEEIVVRLEAALANYRSVTDEIDMILGRND